MSRPLTRTAQRSQTTIDLSQPADYLKAPRVLYMTPRLATLR